MENNIVNNIEQKYDLNSNGVINNRANTKIRCNHAIRYVRRVAFTLKPWMVIKTLPFMRHHNFMMKFWTLVSMAEWEFPSYLVGSITMVGLLIRGIFIY